MYLSEISIKNFRGIRQLTTTFNPKLNVIIGENGCHKSTLIDAIRLLYSMGEQQKSIYVSEEDFYIDSETRTPTSKIELSYKFLDLTPEEKGVYNAFLVCSTTDSSLDYLNINLSYEFRNGRSPSQSYYTGAEPGQRADIKNFELFQHYYLSPLRNSTRDLLGNRGNVLSNLLMRRINTNQSGQNYEGIVTKANDDLLKQSEVSLTRKSINDNLDKIFQKYPENKVGLQIEQSKIDNVINLIKPYLPFDATNLVGNGFLLEQNSLGFNNLIYIAVVLGDIEQRTAIEKNSHFVLLIEEPEAHLHPQLLLNLYNFLNTTNTSSNSQLFITTHSPTLTSKVPLDNLMLLDDEKAFLINNCFLNRETECIVQDTSTGKALTFDDFQYKKKQLQRYIDVTRSQLFYAKGILLIEGISEEMLVPAFCQILGYRIEDFRLEIVNVDGISFYPFLCLFNSSDSLRRLPKKVAILSDDDIYTDSKEPKYSFGNLINDGYASLYELSSHIKKAEKTSNRVQNLESFSSRNPTLLVRTAMKTLEFEISLSNVTSKRSKMESNLYVKYIQKIDPIKFAKIQLFYQSLPKDDFSEDEKRQIAILLWKAMPSKADFAQDFAIYLIENLKDAKQNFVVPSYIIQALKHLTNE